MREDDVIITYHAEERMRQRGITRPMVYAALEHGTIEERRSGAVSYKLEGVHVIVRAGPFEGHNRDLVVTVYDMNDSRLVFTRKGSPRKGFASRRQARKHRRSHVRC